jgi:hypothetical protein
MSDEMETNAGSLDAVQEVAEGIPVLKEQS